MLCSCSFYLGENVANLLGYRTTAILPIHYLSVFVSERPANLQSAVGHCGIMKVFLCGFAEIHDVCSKTLVFQFKFGLVIAT